MNKGSSYARLFGRAIKVAFASRAAYRTDFGLSVLMTVLLELITPLVTILIYGSGSSFPGWSMGEALLIQAIFLLSRGIAFPWFFGIVGTVFERVREGTFELTLLKPRSPLLVCMVESFDVQGLGRLLGGITLFVYALGRVPAPGPLQILLFAVLLFAQYPGSIYGRTFQIVLAVLLPAAMIAFLPAQALLGRPEPITVASAPASVAFFLAATAFWRAMVKRYAGGGG